MTEALAYARRSLETGEMPIGAVVALDGDVVAGASWRGDFDSGLLRHPELVALLEADASVGRRRRDAVLYTTLEPCLMCMGAAMSFFVRSVVYALASPHDGAADVADRWAPRAGHPRPAPGTPYRIPEIIGGVCAAEARALIEEYVRRTSGGQAVFAATILRG